MYRKLFSALSITILIALSFVIGPSVFTVNAEDDERGDGDSPHTSIRLSGTKGDNDWYISNVVVTLSASFLVRRIEYSLDNAIWIRYTTPFTITEEGNTTIFYKSTDRHGEEETAKNMTIGIDKTIPVGSINVNDNATYTASATVSVASTAFDSVSGVYQVRYSNDIWDIETWRDFSPTQTLTLTPGDGAKTVYYEIRDYAGLISSTYSDTIMLDTTPVLDIIEPVADAGIDQTLNEDTPVILDASGSSDNVGIVSYSWTFTDATARILTGEKPTYAFNTPASYTITLKVTDSAGNWATDTVVVTVLDITKPVAAATLIWTGANLTFNAAPSSDNVGIVSYEWDFGDGTTGTGKKTSHVFANGAYSVTLTIRDAAGNTDTYAKSVTISQANAVADIRPWIMGASAAAAVCFFAVAMLLRRRGYFNF